jgi:hypothetical protein
MANLLDKSCPTKLPYGMASAKNIDLGNVVLFTMLQNHEHKTIEWLLAFSSETEKLQWMELVTPPTASPENPEEKIYETWDCPLVEAVASVEGEVPLAKGDKANVLRKLSDSGNCNLNNKLAKPLLLFVHSPRFHRKKLIFFKLFIKKNWGG